MAVGVKPTLPGYKPDDLDLLAISACLLYHIFYLFSIVSPHILTTCYTTYRTGLRGFSSTRYNKNAWYSLQESTKYPQVALEKPNPCPWGGRGRKFKSCHSDQKSVEIAQFLRIFLFVLVPY